LRGLLVSTPARGELFHFRSESSLIEQSELIVTGTWLARTQVSVPSAALELHLAVIQIDTVLKGDPSRRVALLVLPAPTPGIHNSGTIT
jgi:hypothetical protein